MPEIISCLHETWPGSVVEDHATRLVLEKAFESFGHLCNENLVSASWTWVKGLERFIATVCDSEASTSEDYLNLLCRAHERCWALRTEAWGDQYAA